MPYIDPIKRHDFAQHIDALAVLIDNPGDLNYLISALLADILSSYGNVDYQLLSKWRAGVNDASDEFYRRVMVPYEHGKMEKNGDVYDGLMERMLEKPELAAYQCDCYGCKMQRGEPT